MLKIRLQRTGKKNQPFFRIIVCDKRNAAKAGRSLEVVGFFNPLTKEKNVKADRVKYWLSVGAQPSDRAHNLFVKEGIIKADKIAVHAKAKKKEGDDKKEDKESTTDPNAEDTTSIATPTEEAQLDKTKENTYPFLDKNKLNHWKRVVAYLICFLRH